MDLWRTAVVGESADTRSCDAVSCASLMPVRCVSLQAVHPARWFDAVRLPYAKSASQGGERGRRGSMWVLNSGEDQCGGLVWAENGTAGFVTARALRRHRHDELVTAMSPVHAALCLCAGPRLVPMRVGVRGHQRRPALVSLWFSSCLCAFACEGTSADQLWSRFGLARAYARLRARTPAQTHMHTQATASTRGVGVSSSRPRSPAQASQFPRPRALLQRMGLLPHQVPSVHCRVGRLALKMLSLGVQCRLPSD